MGSNNLNTKLVKQAHKKVAYTPDQVQELNMCMDQNIGPSYFMEKFVYIQHPTQGHIKYVPFEYQKELVRAYHDNRYSIALLGRQLGKTTVAAGYLLWYAMFVPDSTILVAAHKFAGTQEIMERIRYIYEFLPDHIRAGVTSYNKQSISFDNKSRIIAQTTTTNTGRGLSLSLVYLDEFAFVEPRIAKEFWTSLSPTLSTGGKCIITSTPNSDEDQLAEIWFDANKRTDEYGNERPNGVGKNGFFPFMAKWNQHPDRNEKWANEERIKIGEERFRREHECEFLIFEETLINPMFLNTVEGKQPIRKAGEIRWFEEINPNSTYVVGLDPSAGTGGNDAAIQVFELQTMKQVAEWRHNKSPAEQQIRVLRSILEEIDSYNVHDLYWSVETNTLGESILVIIRDTGEEYFPGTMLHDPTRDHAPGRKRMGFFTTNKSKLEACIKFKSLVEAKKLKINSGGLISELKTFVASGPTFKAKTGQKDDLVSASLLVIRMCSYISVWDNTAYNVMSGDLKQNGNYDEYSRPMPIKFL